MNAFATTPVNPATCLVVSAEWPFHHVQAIAPSPKPERQQIPTVFLNEVRWASLLSMKADQVTLN